jgi:DNA gyrase subunit A
MAEQINETQIEKEMQSSYIDYAMSVIVGRALPDARDGLKPAQRRILYAMYKLNNTHSNPTKKSARIVGDTIGKYHPHGDLAVYETLVRMAQTFSMNHTLVEGQGNFGSIDGDPPAAQRYTEVRLNLLAEEMLQDLEKEAVKYIPNFDNTEEEPVVLPSKVPNLLLNGSSGIAVGVATNMPPHNLNEIADAIIAYVDNPAIEKQDILNIIKGPDFPTGGLVFYNENLIRSYMTGRGSVTIRGKTKIEEGKNKKIIITELPYQVNKATLVEKIADLVKDKKLPGISYPRDESDKAGIRVVIEVHGDANPEYILSNLYAHTQLEVTLPMMNIAVLGTSLLTLNIKDSLKIFVEHRLDVIKKRTAYDLRIASEKLHIIEGLVLAVDDIDTTIGIIKGSKDSKSAHAALMNKFSLDEKQATAIMDLRIGRLTTLDTGQLRDEKVSLEKQIKEFSEILQNESKVYKIIKDETEEIKKKFGVPRKTTIDYGEQFKTIMSEDLIKDEESVIILTKDGYLKRLQSSDYRQQGRGGRGVISIDLKEGDSVKSILTCMSKDYLFVISTMGRGFWLKAYMVPQGSRYSSATAAVNLIKLQEGEKVAGIINTRAFASSYLVFLTRKGRIKRVKAELFSHPRSSGIRAMSIPSGDELADVAISSGQSNVFIASAKGKGLRFKEIDIRAMGRTALGVRGIRLKEGDSVIGVIAAAEGSLILSITKHGLGKITQIEKYRLQKRGGQGVLNVKLKDNDSVVEVLDVSKSEDIILINSSGIAIQIPVASIRQTGRSASGVRLMKLAQGSHVVGAQCL